MLLDYVLGDDDGLKLGLEIQTRYPGTQIVMMTGGQIPSEEEAVCNQRDIPILRKPFLAEDVLSLIADRLFKVSAASQAHQLSADEARG